MAHETFQAGDLTAVIGDNEAYEGQRAGYNGIQRLTHRSAPASVFPIAGLNFEHIWDGDQDQASLAGDKKTFFEPRNHPMEFRRLSAVEAELHQTPTPAYFLESWTRFKLVEPHAIDFSFRCRPHQHAFRYGYIGLFWASYIQAPENKSIYFRSREGWIQLCTQGHNNQSSVRHVDDAIEPTYSPSPHECLYKNLSPLRYAEPFFYGHAGNHVLIFMFEKPDGLRFAHSPSSGGPPHAPNPAWDFQYLLPAYDVGRDYGFRARLVYRERCSRDEILKEVAAWRDSLSK